jgi:hypothetical protein
MKKKKKNFSTYLKIFFVARSHGRMNYKNTKPNMSAFFQLTC